MMWLLSLFGILFRTKCNFKNYESTRDFSGEEEEEVAMRKTEILLYFKSNAINIMSLT